MTRTSSSGGAKHRPQARMPRVTSAAPSPSRDGRVKSVHDDYEEESAVRASRRPSGPPQHEGTCACDPTHFPHPEEPPEAASRRTHNHGACFEARRFAPRSSA
jgi:hypothetical protein